MGTHPIFESDFDCLTESKSVAMQISSRLRRERRSLWKSRPPTLLKMSRPRSRTKKAFRQISNGWSSLASSWKMAELFRTTTSRRSLLSIWSFVCVVASLSPLSECWRKNITATRDLPQVLRPNARSRHQLPKEVLRPHQQLATKEEVEVKTLFTKSVFFLFQFNE